VQQAGFMLEVPTKTSLWQVKARLMEFTGIPPISGNLSLTPQSKPLGVRRSSDASHRSFFFFLFSGLTVTWQDVETLFDLGLRNGAMLYFSLKPDAAKGAQSCAGCTFCV
jgi:hypothetical protein